MKKERIGRKIIVAAMAVAMAFTISSHMHVARRVKLLLQSLLLLQECCLVNLFAVREKPERPAA